MKDTRIEIICPICRKKHLKALKEAFHVCCSNLCGQKLRSKNSLAKYPKDIIEKMYLEEKRSLRFIASFFGLKDAKRIRHVFQKYGISMRHGSEAIKTQWIGNEMRKKQFSELMKKLNPSKGRTEKYLISINRSRHRHNIWSRHIRERDKKCLDCGSQEKLVAHHLKSMTDFPELQYELSNGVSLCMSCHSKRHQTGIR